MKGFSSKTQLNNEFKLADLAKSLIMSREEKDEFKLLESLTLSHALNAETTGLKATANVELIYVFRLKHKSKEAPLKFLKALDKKTKAHTVFEIENGSGYTYIIANKRVADTIGIGEYIERETTEEWELPQDHNAQTLEDLYCLMLSFVLNLQRRPGDTADSLVSRKKHITELEKEIAKLERKKNGEVQFNKRVAINEEIRALKAEIEGVK